MISDRTLKWRSSLPASGGIIRLGGEVDQQALLALSSVNSSLGGERLHRPTRRRRGVMARSAASSALMAALRAQR
jgi:hypothetical protein